MRPNLLFSPQNSIKLSRIPTPWLKSHLCAQSFLILFHIPPAEQAKQLVGYGTKWKCGGPLFKNWEFKDNSSRVLNQEQSLFLSVETCTTAQVTCPKTSPWPLFLTVSLPSPRMSFPMYLGNMMIYSPILENWRWVAVLFTPLPNALCKPLLFYFLCKNLFSFVILLHYTSTLIIAVIFQLTHYSSYFTDGFDTWLSKFLFTPSPCLKS